MDKSIDEIIRVMQSMDIDLRYQYSVDHEVNIGKLSQHDFARVLTLFRWMDKAVAIKLRADAGDEAAQIRLKFLVYGDPRSRREEDMIGFKGRFDQGSETHGFTLLAMGMITQQEFDQKFGTQAPPPAPVAAVPPAPPSPLPSESVEDAVARIRERMKKFGGGA